MIQKIGSARPTYGTRRMAAQAFRELNYPVNRKAVRRGWCVIHRNRIRPIRYIQ